MGWPVADGLPGTEVARIRESCAAHGVTHRYGFDPDVYLVLADVAPGAQAEELEAAVRRELAGTAGGRWGTSVIATSCPRAMPAASAICLAVSWA